MAGFFQNVGKSILSRLGNIVGGLTRTPQPHPVRKGGSGRRGGLGGGLPMTIKEVQAFIYDANVTYVGSSNVVAGRYFLDSEKLVIEFNTGGIYLYSSISEEDARVFLRRKSKGGFVWDYLRIRGTKLGHKKPYIRLR